MSLGSINVRPSASSLPNPNNRFTVNPNVTQASPTISDRELGEIYQSYLDLYCTYILFLLISLGIFLNIIHYAVLFVYFWINHSLDLWRKTHDCLKIPRNQILQKTAAALGIGEIILFIVAEVNQFKSTFPQ